MGARFYELSAESAHAVAGSHAGCATTALCNGSCRHVSRGLRPATCWPTVIASSRSLRGACSSSLKMPAAVKALEMRGRILNR